MATGPRAAQAQEQAQGVGLADFYDGYDDCCTAPALCTAHQQQQQQQQQQGQCAECGRRVEALRCSGFGEAAGRCGAAWEASLEACWGLCACSQLCEDHALPLRTCLALHPGLAEEHHSVLVLRSKWVRRSSLDASQQQQQQQQQQRQQQCGCSGAACALRLRKMMRSDWARKDPQSTQRVQELQEQAERGLCVGVCRTPYFCKVHLCPAARARPAGPTRSKATQFVCQRPHDRVANGRHHELFAFWCESDRCCAPGKWFSREETHRSAVRKARGADPSSSLQPPGAAAVADEHPVLFIDRRAEDAVRPADPTRNADRRGGGGPAPAAKRRYGWRLRGGDTRLLVALLALASVLLCGAAAAVGVLAARPCSAGALRAAAAAVDSRGCPEAVDRQLCFAHGGQAVAQLKCVNCSRAARGNSSAEAWACRGTLGSTWLVQLRVDSTGAYTLEATLLHEDACIVCTPSSSNGTLDSPRDTLVLADPAGMSGWSFVFR
eukprot:m51a1_g7047 hypothetical protein (494) ;mRNA; f:129284-131270